MQTETCGFTVTMVWKLVLTSLRERCWDDDSAIVLLRPRPGRSVYFSPPTHPLEGGVCPDWTGKVIPFHFSTLSSSFVASSRMQKRDMYVETVPPTLRTCSRTRDCKVSIPERECWV